MIVINAAALKLTLAKLQTTRKAIVKQGDEGFRQKIYYLFNALLKVSPQFSGEFVYNWNLAVNGDLGSFRSYAGKAAGDGSRSVTKSDGTVGYAAARHRAGDEEAMASPRARMTARLKGLKLGDKVHFINLTDMYVGSQGDTMISPGETVNLRPENVIPGNVRIESYIRALAKNPPPLKATP